MFVHLQYLYYTQLWKFVMIIYIAFIKNLLDSNQDISVEEKNKTTGVALEIINRDEAEPAEENKSIHFVSRFNKSIAKVFQNIFSVDESEESGCQFEVNIGPGIKCESLSMKV